jgi:site-specific recombinase XerD
MTYKRGFSGRRLVEHTKTRNIRFNYIFPEVQAVLPQRGLPTTFVFTHGQVVKKPHSSEYLNKIFRVALQGFSEEHGTNVTIELYEATKHSFGTQLINEGIPENYLQEWFGHSKSDMTKRYAKLKVVDVFRKLKNVVPIDQAKSSIDRDRQ